jgi:hypothetical protein
LEANIRLATARDNAAPPPRSTPRGKPDFASNRKPAGKPYGKREDRPYAKPEGRPYPKRSDDKPRRKFDDKPASKPETAFDRKPVEGAPSAPGKPTFGKGRKSEDGTHRKPINTTPKKFSKRDKKDKKKKRK